MKQAESNLPKPPESMATFEAVWRPQDAVSSAGPSHFSFQDTRFEPRYQVSGTNFIEDTFVPLPDDEDAPFSTGVKASTRSSRGDSKPRPGSRSFGTKDRRDLYSPPRSDSPSGPNPASSRSGTGRSLAKTFSLRIPENFEDSSSPQSRRSLSPRQAHAHARAYSQSHSHSHTPASHSSSLLSGMLSPRPGRAPRAMRKGRSATSMFLDKVVDEAALMEDEAAIDGGAGWDEDGAAAARRVHAKALAAIATPRARGPKNNDWSNARKASEWGAASAAAGPLSSSSSGSRTGNMAAAAAAAVQVSPERGSNSRWHSRARSSSQVDAERSSSPWGSGTGRAAGGGAEGGTTGGESAFSGARRGRVGGGACSAVGKPTGAFEARVAPAMAERPPVPEGLQDLSLFYGASREEVASSGSVIFNPAGGAVSEHDSDLAVLINSPASVAPAAAAAAGGDGAVEAAPLSPRGLHVSPKATWTNQKPATLGRVAGGGGRAHAAAAAAAAPGIGASGAGSSAAGAPGVGASGVGASGAGSFGAGPSAISPMAAAAIRGGGLSAMSPRLLKFLVEDKPGAAERGAGRAGEGKRGGDRRVRQSGSGDETAEGRGVAGGDERGRVSMRSRSGPLSARARSRASATMGGAFRRRPRVSVEQRVPLTGEAVRAVRHFPPLRARPLQSHLPPSQPLR
ncbi:unnamed protein product [Closterium sp. NIES-53]